MADIAWPIDSRELHTQLYDSTAWNDFGLRAEDIVISTWAKSGTTWTQQIVAQLLFDGAEDLEVAEMSPWLDLRVTPSEVELHGSGSTNSPALRQDTSSGGCSGLRVPVDCDR